MFDDFSAEGPGVEYIDLADFMAEHPGRVKVMRSEEYGLSFYRVGKCACVGDFGQYIFPLGPDGKMRQVLNESFAFSIPDVNKNIVGSTGNAEEFVPLDLAVALYPLWSDTFWHWCMEGLPKLLVLERMGYAGPYIVHKNCSFITESLHLLGIPDARIIYNTTSFVVQSLIVPQPFYGGDLANNLPLLDLLRASILNGVEPYQGPERLYLPRPTTRRVLNEDQLLPILRQHGFKVAMPDNLPFARQVQLMMNVRLSVMPHGAASFLTLFQRPDSYRIELFSNSYTHYHSMPMIKLLNLWYVPIVESYKEPFELEDHRRKQIKDIKVPIDLFKAILENIMKRLDN